jgi:L-gulonate 5-dehydrogenase
MKQVLLEAPRAVRIAEAELPTLAPGQALVQLRSAGICGSDLAAYRGSSPMVSYPRVLGHELVVDVLECADRPELVGRRAIIDPMTPCGHCRACRAGRSNCCANLQVMGVHIDGGMQAMAGVASRRLFAVPDSMPDDLAVLAEPLTIAYHAVERADIRAGETALVFGAGAIGLLIAQLLLRARGCRVLVSDVDVGRLRIAERMGAIPIQSDEATLVQAVARETGGELAAVVFEATGVAACTRMTTAAVAQAGKIVLIGWNKGAVEVDTVALMHKEVDLLGSRNSLNAFPPVLQLLADGVVDAGTMITHRFGLNEAQAALDVLDRGQDSALKIVLVAHT